MYTIEMSGVKGEHDGRNVDGALYTALKFHSVNYDKSIKEKTFFSASFI